VIIAVDPGVVTGVATWDHEFETFASSQEEAYGALVRIDNALRIGTPPVETVVCEAYTITAATLRKTRQPASLESIGALRYLCRRSSVEFVLQTPADAKRFAGAPRYDKLRRAGWYFPTPGGHANDAAAHLLTYLANNEPQTFRAVIGL